MPAYPQHKSKLKAKILNINILVKMIVKKSFTNKGITIKILKIISINGIIIDNINISKKFSHEYLLSKTTIL